MSQSFINIVDKMVANTTEFIATCKENYIVEMNDTIKNEVSISINGTAMYDCNQIEKSEEFILINNMLSGKISKYRCDNGLNPGQYYVDPLIRNDKIIKSTLLEKEVGITLVKYDKNSNNRAGTYAYAIITNYSRIISYDGSDVYDAVGIDMFNYWLPLDYIKILSSIKELNYGTNPLKLIQSIKDQFYNRTFVPLYVKDIIAENDELKTKYEQYVVDKENLDSIYADYVNKLVALDTELQPYINIQRVTEANAARAAELDKRERDLITMARRLKIERAELDEERRKLLDISLDDIINKNRLS